MTPRVILVTGEAEFIGSDVVWQPMVESDTQVVTVDKQTYSGNPVPVDNALTDLPPSVCGKGENMRDCPLTDGQAQALRQALCHGEVGTTYSVGGVASSSLAHKNSDVTVIGAVGGRP